MITISLFIVGLMLLWLGGVWLINGASQLASKFKLPDFLIGLTVVAFGTSAPELVVNIIAAIGSKTDIIIGNIVGSNIANSLLILGISALITPILIKRQTAFNEFIFNIAVVLLLVIMLVINDAVLVRVFSLIFLISFVLMIRLFMTVSPDQVQQEPVKQTSILMIVLLCIFGSFGLAFGGFLTISSAESIAANLGISNGLVAMVAIAFGTSLPELVAAIIACIHRKPEFIIGNVLGSNIFNILLIFGISNSILDIPFSISQQNNVLSLLIFSILLFISLFIRPKYTISKFKGLCFVSLYLSYITYLGLTDRL